MVGPWIHATIVIIDFLIIPLITLFNITSNWKEISESNFSDYLALQAVIQGLVIIYSPFRLKHTIYRSIETA